MRHAAPAMTVVLVMALCGDVSAATVDERIHARLARDGAARVLVELVQPDAPIRSRALGARKAAVALGQREVLRAMAPAAVTVLHTFEILSGFTATVTPAGLAALASHSRVISIDADREGGGALDISVPQIRADRVHGRGLIGTNTTVAVLDSGIDAQHPDVSDALVGEECFCVNDCCPRRTARASGPGSAASVSAHGVHVTGVLLSRGRVSPVGVAPGARVFAVRVIDDNNRGFLVDWLSALDWVAANLPEVRVVNMSLGTNYVLAPPCDEADSFTRGLAQLTALLRSRGTLVVAAAGNNSSTAGLTVPGCVAGVITVGAVDANDMVANFSNGGSGIDLFAPGDRIISDAPGGTTVVISGTSVATPHVSGTLALLTGAQPTASAETLDTTLRETGVAVLDPRTNLVTPRVDAFAALTALARQAELLRGSGSRRADCLIEWSIVPPSIARDGRHPMAECMDNDVLCDLDSSEGQCTFQLSACFNQHDPLLPDCPLDESIRSFRLTSPAPDAPQMSRERTNADNLLQSLPGFPLADTNVCGVAFPFVVPVGQPATIRASVATATRRDYDRVTLRCIPQR